MFSFPVAFVRQRCAALVAFDFARAGVRPRPKSYSLSSAGSTRRFVLFNQSSTPGLLLGSAVD